MPPFIYIDRRKAGHGKSSENRQKLIKRVKQYIKTSVPQNIGSGGSITGSGIGSNNSSPVKIAGSALEEPWFAYANDGINTTVVIGNQEYNRGDEVFIPEENSSQSSAGQGDSGEDDFIVNVARDEFLDLFFEDCELPNLTNEKYIEKLDNKMQHAGFSTSGTPAQLSIIRTYKQSLARRTALKGPFIEEKEALENELEQLEKNKITELEESRIAEIKVRLAELENKFLFIDGFDDTDLRFRKKESKPLKTVDALLIMIMDVSGSMDQEKKTIARRWFALLYAFIKRRYTNTELVFIAHHDEAFEMSEGDFFSTKMNGGTSVSPALKMANKIIKERYDPNETNIYVCHASDGDNWASDNMLVVDEMVGAGHLCNKIQLFSYVEVGPPSSGWFTSTIKNDTNLWEAYEKCRDTVSYKKLNMAIIPSADDCYGVFKKVFKKS